MTTNGHDVQESGMCDFVVITIREDENRAVLARFPQWQFVPRHNRTYTVADIRHRSGQRYSVAVVRTPEQGPNAAHDTARDAIEDLDPRCIVVVGIAGAIPDREFSMGDVIVGTRLHDFTVGAFMEGAAPEFTNQGGPVKKDVQDLVALLPALEGDLDGWQKEPAIRVPRPTVDNLPTNFYGGEDWQARTRAALDYHFLRAGHRTEPIVTTRAIAASGFLITDTTLVERWRTSARDVMAVEMELAGVYSAARRLSREYPVIAIRGISDIIGFKREPEWTTYACETAASFCAYLLRNIPSHYFGRSRYNEEPTPTVESTGAGPDSGQRHQQSVAGVPGSAGSIADTRGKPHRANTNDDAIKHRAAMFLDQSEDAFLNHLSSHSAVWIVGITNQHLVTYLERAYALRDETPWDEVRIIFQARHLVGDFGDGEQDRVQNWETGVRQTLQFFLQSGSRKAKKLDIRHSNRILPFVGQFYDYSHVRVAFVLHVPHIHTGCYLNLRLSKSNISGENVPNQQLLDQTLTLEQYRALQYAFEDLRNASTPLLTANVIGARGNDGSFIFGNLIPQNNWRHYRAVLHDRPAHLVTFVLLLDRDRIFLQYRNQNNSRGQTETYGVLPGKVNDEDFFEISPEPRYWGEIYEMQKAFNGIENDRRKWPDANAACRRASDAFANATGVRVGASISDVRLVDVCRRSACRYLDEKLGLDMAANRLEPVSPKQYFVEKQEYSLYIKLFALRIKPAELDRIRARRPFADVRGFDLEEFRTLRKDRKLTMFLEQNFDDIVLFLQGAWAMPQRAFRKRANA